ncbi:unnamed protein product [Pieris brassicae]|uniref:Uncharacterized protein n=1 Tax=Pieris brassicae TaxID=7116 RepID=A0A9P0X7C0_PIEBR|nr:unnamed protein product [Pieris brassicae]
MLKLLQVSALLISIKFVSCLTYFKIDNIENLKQLPKILETIQNHDLTEHIKLTPNQNKYVSEGNLRNKILVKRKIPHGLDAGAYEFDNKFNTFYKPLIRVHKKINIGKNSKNALQQFEDKYDVSNDEAETRDPKDVWNERLYIDKFNKKEYDYLVFVTKRNNRKKISNVKQRRGLAFNEIMSALSKNLRAYEKSGEANDPLAPGPKIPMNIHDGKEDDWMPHYPPWNYWTYKKTLHQDACPGTQVRIGNMCMWIPPH